MIGASQGIALFTTLLPSRSALYHASPTDTVKQNVRQGELVASVLTLGFAGVLFYLSKDKAPLLIAGATVATMIIAYEYTMHVQPIGTGNGIVD